MLFELRSYELRPGKAPVYLEFFRTFGLGLVTRHLPMGGYWMAETGALNRIEHLWIYADMAERDACRAALAGDGDWMQGFVPRAFGDVVRQENRLMALEQTSPALDAVIAGRRRSHASETPDTPMFAPGLMALGLSRKAPDVGRAAAGFRVLSGEAPGSRVTLAPLDMDRLERDGAGLDRHTILRPLGFSPLGGTRG